MAGIERQKIGVAARGSTTPNAAHRGSYIITPPVVCFSLNKLGICSVFFLI